MTCVRITMATRPSTNEELYYQVAAAQKLEQDNRHRQLEAKATAVLAVAATLLGLASFTAPQWSSWSFIPASVLLVAFLWTAWWAVRAVRVREYDISPQLEELSRHLGSYPIEKLTEWVADALSKAIKGKEAKLVSMASELRRAGYGLAGESFALGGLMLSVGIGVVSK